MESLNYHFSCKKKFTVKMPILKEYDLLERKWIYFENWWYVNLEQNWCGGLCVLHHKYQSNFCCITFSWHDNLGQETLSDPLKFTAMVAHHHRPTRLNLTFTSTQKGQENYVRVTIHCGNVASWHWWNTSWSWRHDNMQTKSQLRLDCPCQNWCVLKLF